MTESEAVGEMACEWLSQTLIESTVFESHSQATSPATSLRVA